MVHMRKPWDRRMKLLFNAAPQDFVDWLLSGATFVHFVSVELDGGQLYTDILIELNMSGKKVLLHAEFQRRRDSRMRERLWEYNVRATLKYDCPVWSCVIYLKKDSVVKESFLTWQLPNGRRIHRFDFEVIKLWEIPTQVLKQKGLKGLLPLLPLTKGGTRREVVEEIIAELAPADEEPEGELLTLAYGFASLAFDKEADQDWLVGRFSMLYDILRETRAFKELAKEGLQQGLQEGLQQGLQRGLQQGLQQGLEQGRKEGQLEGLRQALLKIVEARFPDKKMIRLAKDQVAHIENLEVLQRVLINVSVAQTREEALERLIDWQEGDADTDEHPTV